MSQPRLARLALTLLALLALAAHSAVTQEVGPLNSSTIQALNAALIIWTPKFVGSAAGNAYDPKTKDWVSLVSACEQLITYEKRIGSFITRAAFHDALAVDAKACMDPAVAANGGCGADASLLLSLAELTAPQNTYDAFATTAAQAILRLASWFDTSVADALAVCAAVAPKVLSKGRIDIISGSSVKNIASGLRVGRLDSNIAADTGAARGGGLPGAAANVAQLSAFWASRGLTADEGWALMGSHSLLDTQACFRGPTVKEGYCDLRKENCTDVRMFKWENHYYHDACTATLKMTLNEPNLPNGEPAQEPEPADTPILGMGVDEVAAEERHETCKFSSTRFRNKAAQAIRDQRAGLAPADPAEPPADYSISWSNSGCARSSRPVLQGGAGASPTSCPHSTQWLYTTADAFAGVACQATGPLATPQDEAVRTAYRSFLDTNVWDATYARAFRKMVDNSAVWSPRANLGNGLSINGRECASGYVAQKRWCTDGALLLQPFQSCSPCKVDIRLCPPCCQCITTMAEGWAARLPDANIFPTPPVIVEPAPLPPAGPVPDLPLPTATEADSIVVPLPSPFNPLNPPYATDRSKICPTLGARVLVRGFPSSPFAFTPFSRPFQTPSLIAPSVPKRCRPGLNGTQHCIIGFEMDIGTGYADFSCPSLPGASTRVLTYSGMSPGPTIVVPVGTEAVVRFVNKIPTVEGSTFAGLEPHPPCVGHNSTGRYGRPISVHFHGSASLAPYDGWADDSTCGGEAKDYVLPVSKAKTGWYHGHHIDITSENAYFGLAGFFLASDKASDGGCGSEPFNLESIPQSLMLLSDKVLDSNCQLYYDHTKYHQRNLYGDIQTVNGVPWPVMSVAPTWHRFRFLNAAPGRPYKLRIVDDTGADVSGKSGSCYVVSGDGGNRAAPVSFPPAGIFLGVAERYEVVCNFQSLAGRTLYLLNVKDDERMKNVPFFCFSHLIAKVVVAACPATSVVPGKGCVAPVQLDTSLANQALLVDSVVSSADYQAGLALAKAGKCTRYFKFGRRRGHWVINGEDWHSMRVAAADVGQNTWEVWCLRTGGGWFHPIHIHLIDMYVMLRNGVETQVHGYEKFTPKDVVQLDPSAEVALFIRFGPHRGEYMFHCHNLVHEDFEMLRSFTMSTGASGRTATTHLGGALNQVDTINSIPYDSYYSPLSDPGTASPMTLPAKQQLALDLNLHFIFYPRPNTAEGILAQNPWVVPTCPASPPPPPAKKVVGRRMLSAKA